jgi:hypothetical protein
MYIKNYHHIINDLNLSISHVYNQRFEFINITCILKIISLTQKNIEVKRISDERPENFI